MSFDDLVTEVLQRTRQTSAEAQTRIGRAINDRYRRVTSAIGLTTARRGLVTVSTLIGTPEVTFSFCSKILSIFRTTPDRYVLQEITFDEWRQAQMSALSGPPMRYAIKTMDARDIAVCLDPVPNLTITMSADALIPATPLTGLLTPSFSADFHDILMHGALADEWLQLKQDDLAARSEAAYENRLADLRLFIAKSAYLDIYQGKRTAVPYWSRSRWH